MAWKKRKIHEKRERLAKEEEQKKKDYKSGKQFGLSGKEMFSFNPDLADDGPVEEGDAVFDSYDREDDDDEGVYEYKDLDLADISMAAQEVIFHVDKMNEFRDLIFFINSRSMEPVLLHSMTV